MIFAFIISMNQKPIAMKPYLLIVIMLLSAGIMYSQEYRRVQGVMKDKSGEPIIGVTIIVKGTTQGVVTDMDGKYSIVAPLGSVLTFSYIGFSTKEMKVTLQNSEPAPAPVQEQFSTPVPKVTYKSSFEPLAIPEAKNEDTTSSQKAEGTAVFTSKTPSFTSNDYYNYITSYNVDVNRIGSIDFNNNQAKFNFVNDKYYAIPHISYYTSFSTEQFTKLPKLQNQYAQGRPVNEVSIWRGPETGEILSWGPDISNLEQAKAYNPANAFRKGYVYINSLKVYYNTERLEYSILYNNRMNGGILPGNLNQGNNAELKWKRNFRLVKVSTQFNYNNIKSNYLEGSPVNTLVMASLLTTPPTFDITNNEKARKAYNNKSSYLIDENTQRSYAPGSVNNPYWLLHNSADNETQELLSGFLKAEVKVSAYFQIAADACYQKQENVIRSGYYKIPAGVDQPASTYRNETLNSFASSLGIIFQRYFNRIDLNSIIQYNNYISESRLKRHDAWLTDDSNSIFAYSFSRKEHNINWTSNLSTRKGFLLKISQNLSGDNRSKKNGMYYSPTVALGLNVHDLIYFYRTIETLKLKSNWGYNYAFAPMNYTFGKFNYQNFNSTNFYNTSFNQEIIPNLSLKPEKVLKKDIGLELGLFNNKLTLEMDVYEHRTSNAIYPVLKNNSPVLENIATHRIRGIDAEINFQQRIARANAQFRLVFDRFKTQVLDLYSNNREIILGGFADVHTSLVKGLPAGVVVGTAWQRDSEGNMMIGNDGYPLVAKDLKVIATPDPDFTLGLETSIDYKSFTVNILMEYRHGGQIWNGTQNVLSYAGLSEKTAKGRNVTGYIFPGVKEDGSINTTPVDFANPANGLEQNRWYKYGLTGVAEDAIQDASCFRIREISLTYRFPHCKFNPEIAVFARNPLLITKYKGVDPNITLWEKSNTQGLDLFNMPSVSSIGISAKINL
jgi:hypothetical protein